jgi:hypothetical protein
MAETVAYSLNGAEGDRRSSPEGRKGLHNKFNILHRERRMISDNYDY